MGGNTDKSGTIDATKLIQIVKTDFKMTIDIEVLTCNDRFSDSSTKWIGINLDKFPIRNSKTCSLIDKPLFIVSFAAPTIPSPYH
jgi:hypothetical protein